jgi:hypothetical protein
LPKRRAGSTRRSAARRKIAATDRGWLPENWAQFAELGWLAIPFSEDDGGIGFGPDGKLFVAVGDNAPMLDPVLSGGLLSLVPGGDRYALSVRFTVSAAGAHGLMPLCASALFARFVGTMRHSESLPPFPSHFVVLRLAVPLLCASFRGFAYARRERQGLPGSQETPCGHALL